MLWRLTAFMLCFALCAPALADVKGDALVLGWIAQIPELLPLTAETTTTYHAGKWTASFKHKISFGFSMSSGLGGPFRCDNEFPMGLFNDPLAPNLDPLPQHGATDRIGIGPAENVSHTTYLGKQTIGATVFDVVAVREYLELHIHPASPILLALPDRKDNRISVKWYFDADGIVRRIAFEAVVQIPDPYVSFQSAFDAPPAPVSAELRDAPPLHTTSQPLTATMVVDDIRKPRATPVRSGLQDPLFTVAQPSRTAYTFSRDGSLLAIGGADGLQLIATARGMPKLTLDPFKSARRLDFSLDGKSLAFTDSSGVNVVRTADGSLIRTVAVKQVGANSVRLSPDGKRVAVVNPRYEVEIWNVETGLLECTLKDNRRNYEAIFSADGVRLATLGFNTDIILWDTTTWKIIDRLPLRTPLRVPLALSRDGKYVAAADADNTVLVWNGSGHAPAMRLKGVGHIRSLTFSSDGLRLYAGDSDELSDDSTAGPGYVCWDLASGRLSEDRAPWRPKSWDGIEFGVISPDGRFVAFSGSPSSPASVSVFQLSGRK